MEKFLMKTSGGMEIELSENDMHTIHQHYIEQSTADYLRDTHERWPEDKVQAIAIEARRQMNKYDFTEEEAIAEALKEYKEEHPEEQNETENVVSEEIEVDALSCRRHRGR